MKISPLIKRRLGLGLLAVALLGAMAYVLLRAGPMAPVRVTVTQVQNGTLAPSLFGIGTVEARRAYLIGPTVAGRVRSVQVDVGDAVKAGQMLAEMDPVDLDERSLAQDAAMARAGSAIASAQAQRQDALARRELAAVNARRYVELGQQNFMSTGAVEAKLQEQSSAVAMVSAADANLAAARQDLQRLTAERAGLRQQRDKVRLLAPVDGVVISREAEPGSTVVAGQAVLRVIEPASLWLRVRFDQGRSAGLAAGLAASITLRSNPAAVLQGKVSRVEASSDSLTEERVALIAFDSLPAGLTTGELAEVTLSLPAAASALLLPNPSVQRQADHTGVWRLQEGKLQWAPVRLGLASLEGQVQVLEGLKAGDTVVVHSEKALSANSRIQVVKSLVKNSSIEASAAGTAP